jgi:hypothetical protein
MDRNEIFAAAETSPLLRDLITAAQWTHETSQAADAFRYMGCDQITQRMDRLAYLFMDDDTPPARALGIVAAFRGWDIAAQIASARRYIANQIDDRAFADYLHEEITGAGKPDPAGTTPEQLIADSAWTDKQTLAVLLDYIDLQSWDATFVDFLLEAGRDPIRAAAPATA